MGGVEPSESRIERVECGTIWCIGRNYVLHARELGNPVPDEPVVFTKPRTAVIGDGDQIVIPPISTDVHFETELVIRLGERLESSDEAEARRAVSAIGVGFDMTLRDVQSRAKEGGKPWTVAKGWRTSAPLGPMIPAARFRDLDQIVFTMHLNGEQRQKGVSCDMLFSIEELLVYLSSIFILEPGDLLYTGTPEGVGPVASGDQLRAEIEGYPESAFTVRVA